MGTPLFPPAFLVGLSGILDKFLRLLANIVCEGQFISIEPARKSGKYAVWNVECDLNQPQDNLEAHLLIEQVDGLVAAAGIEGTREILDAFWRSTTSLLETLSSQITQGSLELAATTAHAVKGSAANIGAHRLADTATTIEQACKNGNDDQLAGHLQNIMRDYETVRACFHEHLSKT